MCFLARSNVSISNNTDNNIMYDPNVSLIFEPLGVFIVAAFVTFLNVEKVRVRI